MARRRVAFSWGWWSFTFLVKTEMNPSVVLRKREFGGRYRIMNLKWAWNHSWSSCAWWKLKLSHTIIWYLNPDRPAQEHFKKLRFSIVWASNWFMVYHATFNHTPVVQALGRLPIGQLAYVYGVWFLPDWILPHPPKISLRWFTATCLAVY